MDTNTLTYAFAAGGAATTALGLIKLKSRLMLSRAKHRSLTGHARMSRRIARLIPYYAYHESEFYQVDDAPADVVAKRRAGFARLSTLFAERYPQSRAMTAELREGLPDLQFTSAYRVPFQFSRHVQKHLGTGSVVTQSAGVTVTDADRNVSYDLTGSYGVNVFGFDFYKACMAQGERMASAVGPVLGSYLPCVRDNVRHLRAISGLDAVSFHMSGTEAVMQAVRLARYNTRRRFVVRFAGAYHGWWGDVQPGVGNPIPARDTLTLAEMSERTLTVLRARSDVACVLVNPIQMLHPNGSPPGDSSLIDGAPRRTVTREAYAQWLAALREVCTACGIVLILDEIFVGFRIARRGAQEYFGVQADMVTYGKTIAGGLPIGVVCGKPELMRRFREDRPGDVCLARGTFNAHPAVMASMSAFFERFNSADIQDLYEGLDARWDARAARLNELLRAQNLPLEIAHLSSIWSICHTHPGRYHWLFQYYLRAEGLQLAWTGSGRLIFSLNYSEADFEEVCSRFLRAACAMRDDGWFWVDPARPVRAGRRKILRELLAVRFGMRAP
jgi:glutamate-1-semialdehyde 2,1-aminomutase